MDEDILRFRPREPDLARDEEVQELVSSEEADRVLAVLSELMDNTTSESIRAILEDTCFLIADLIPEAGRLDDEGPDEDDALAA